MKLCFRWSFEIDMHGKWISLLLVFLKFKLNFRHKLRGLHSGGITELTNYVSYFYEDIVCRARLTEHVRYSGAQNKLKFKNNGFEWHILAYK